MRLNIGSGGTTIEGFDNWDIKDGKSADKLPFPNESIDEIYASHILEHFSCRKTQEILAEWVRVLKIGGRLRVAVPNFDTIVDDYRGEKTSQEQLLTEAYLLGSHSDDNDYHKAIFNEAKLRTLLEQAGLDNIAKWEPVMSDCASLRVSLNLEGTKATRKLITPDRVRMRQLRDCHAALTLPRICWTDPAFIINPICARLGINIVRASGVFWDQKLTAAIKDALKKKPKYIITWDYDTICRDKDVVCLHDIMEANPDVSVLFPQQVMREHDHVMMTLKDENGKFKERVSAEEFSGDVLDVNTGHFGLTFIRSDVFEKVPEPWFIGETCADGTWGPNHIDPDIHFWYACQKHNLRLCCAPQVSIGHLELMVTWPNHELRALHQHLSEWDTNGKPKEALGC